MEPMDIKNACIIGAGVSGVVSAKHLLAAGIDVTIYERSSGYGGVWYKAFPSHRSIQSNYSKGHTTSAVRMNRPTPRFTP